MAKRKAGAVKHKNSASKYIKLKRQNPFVYRKGFGSDADY